MSRALAIYRIRKTKVSGSTGKIIPAPGVGLRLANYLDADVVTSVIPSKKIPDGCLIINYGRSVIPKWFDKLILSGGELLNDPRAIANCIDKGDAFKIFEENGVPTLNWTRHREEAQSWLQGGHSVVVRATTTGKMGKGISIVAPGGELPEAPLYTRYWDKTHEFRVHVFRGEVIDYVQKKRMGKAKRKAIKIDEVNMEVRNHKRGWVFARKDIFDYQEIRQLGVDAIAATGLDFGAVDILAKINIGPPGFGDLASSLVCEVNSAPGMSDINTFNRYTDAISSYMDERHDEKQGLQSAPNFIE